MALKAHPKGIAMMKRLILSLAVVASLLGFADSARASQGSCILPTTGTVSGLTLVQDINDCFAAQQSANAGATAPTNIGPAAGMIWLDTSTNFLKIYDGTSWLSLGYVDASGHFWNPPIGGGTATVASATTTDVCSVPQSVLTISGVTTISALGASCQTGQMKMLIFSGSLTLTHNATSLILPNGGNNIATAAGDRAWAAYLGGGNWEIVVYQKADGSAVSASSVFTGAVFYQSPISITLASNTNDWAPSGFSIANRIRVTCSSAINVTGLAGGADGRRVIIENVGSTNNCTLTAQDASSSAANRFGLAGPFILRPASSIELVYDTTTSRWISPAPISASPIAGGFRNLVVTSVATVNVTAPASPNAQMKIVADAITVETQTGIAYRLGAVSVTPSLGSSGANGLDTGTVANNTWYFSYVIYNPTGSGTVAGLWSTASSCGGVALPSGYTACARVGANVTDSSANLMRVVQYGRRAQYSVVIGTNTAIVPVMSNGVAGSGDYNSATLASISISPYVPTTASRIIVSAAPGYKGGGAANYFIAPSTAYGGTQRGPNGSQGLVWPGVGTAGVGLDVDMAIEGSSIGWLSSASGGVLACVGWEDNL